MAGGRRRGVLEQEDKGRKGNAQGEFAWTCARSGAQRMDSARGHDKLVLLPRSFVAQLSPSPCALPVSRARVEDASV